MTTKTETPEVEKAPAGSDAEPLTIIGKPNVKVDAMAKVSGETLFADDIALPRMLFCKIKRSPHPHARLRRIDTSRAEAIEGVLATLVGKELPIPFGILPVSQDEHALCPDKVRFVGDPVAAVAALDEETAERALREIDVDYDVLPPVMSIEDALDAEGEPIHSGDRIRGNVQKAVSLEFGNVDEGFSEADLVREDTFFFEGNTHLPMEQHAAVASFTADGKLTLWSSTQTPHYVHRAMAKVLEMPPSKIRVIACPNGGGFGGKSDPFNHEIVVAKLSMKTRRPVKVTLTREEVFYCHRGRHPVKMWVKTGVKKNGDITAMHFRSFLDGGAYGSYGVASLYYTGALQTVTYKVPRYKFEGLRVFTNKPPCGPKRGHGTVQPRYAIECHLDKIAEELGKSPLAIRLERVVEPFSITANQFKLRTVGLAECLERVAQHSELEKKRGKLPRGRGIGLAASSYITGAGLPIYWNELPHSGVQLKLDRGGGVTAFCGSTDIGQGSDSVLAYVVAEELGTEVEDVHVVTADTHLTPVDLGSYSSRVTLMTGQAAIQAARRLKPLLLEQAAEKLEVPIERLCMAHRRIFDKEKLDVGMDFAEAVVLAEAKFGTLGSTGSYTPPRSPGRYKGAGVGPSATYSYSACVVELEVDPETGVIRIERIWIAHDVGKPINPILAIGQIEGSVYMGLGEVLMEEQVFRRGVHKLPSMLDYKSPTFLEMPPVETILVETLDPEGPYGAKECGQGPLLPVIPAVANAVYDAIGVRIDETPISPDKIVRALEGRLPASRVPDYDFPPPVEVPPL
ncbi:MAG TPA: molybdopterin cofactor-binding domain-containing protein [Vicinamibacteria bacterium]|nr:molybdopterin cofactor-binding domain-containing protein [Vicinamibacteria bacterium]